VGAECPETSYDTNYVPQKIMITFVIVDRQTRARDREGPSG
jgi:hypothetical protein